jgi:hypothetical protein
MVGPCGCWGHAATPTASDQRRKPQSSACGAFLPFQPAPILSLVNYKTNYRQPQAQARNEAMDRGRKETARSGAPFDAFECREQTNRFLAHCWPTAINHEPRNPFRRSRNGSYFYLFFNRLMQLTYGRHHGWHGARTLVHRAAAHTLNQLNNLTLLEN